MPSVPSPIRRLIFSASARATISLCLRAGLDRHRVEERLRLRRKAELAQARPPAPRRGDARCARCASAPPGRDRPHTSRRSPPAAPARCRCWRSPFRGGCAARGSAAPADRPAARANRPTGRRCGRAASASARRAPPYRPHAGRHSPSARQSAAPSRSRCRRRVRRARRAASAPADRRRRRPARPWRAAPRSPAAGRAPRRTCPDIAASAPNTSALSRSVRGSPTISFQPSGSARVRSTASVCGCTSRIDEERFCLRLRGALGQRHRFGRGGRLVEQRGVGDVEPGEIADHGLEVEQRLQPALADLRLIRRIGRVPGRVLQDVALDHRRQDRAGIALADQRGEHLVLRGELAHMRQRLGFAQRAAEIERRLLPDRGRQRLGSSARRGFWRRRVSSIAAMSRGEGPMWRRTKWWRLRRWFERRVHGCPLFVMPQAGIVRINVRGV